MKQAATHQAPTGPTTGPTNGPITGTPDAGFDPAPWQALLGAVRDAFPARFDTPNPSLALTRVLVEACADLDIHARPVPVFLDITRSRTFGSGTHREGGVDERALLDAPTGWTGHLIAIVDLGAGRSALLDPSADRFDRPIRNLSTGGPLAALAALPRPRTGPATGLPPLTSVQPRQGDDTTLTYRPIPLDHPGRDNWTRTEWWHLDTDATRTALRAATEAAAAIRTATNFRTFTGTTAHTS